jgi:hypothetical protein
MSKRRIISISLLLTITACLDAPRDNKYDPENPDQAYLSAFVYELGSYPMEAAIVSLTQDNTTIKSDTSDPAGIIEFEDIIPGIYDITAEALYYSAVSYPPESLWAGVYIESLRIELNTLDFEDDTQGSASPYRFEPVTGSWRIDEDNHQPEAHSAPQVYRGLNNITNGNAISLCPTLAESFLFEANVKVDTSSGDSWRAGFVMRYQDLDNHYAITIAPDTVYCDVVINGQKTTIHATAQVSVPGVWQRLRIERPYGWIFIRVSLNNDLMISVYDNMLSGGQLGLLVGNEDVPVSTTAFFDDVTLDLTYAE